MATDSEHFQEFMQEIKYATGLVNKKKYNLGEYYNHMADFFEYIERPWDAQEHRVLAKKWQIEKGESNDN